MKFLVTGGAGFIGSAVIRFLLKNNQHHILNLDKLTYAGNLNSIFVDQNNDRYKFIKGDISDQRLVSEIFSDFEPDIVMHLAAESHVDRSIDSPAEFIETNIIGTYVMLECSYNYWKSLTSLEKKKIFRFHHISTDEVFGSLGNEGSFNEYSPYNPSSPYSASKASSDHLVRAWHHTYNLPILITNCSNNYGPYQFPEKLIPLFVLNAIEGKSLPIYGDGQQIRDWLFVEDHVIALYKVISEGKVGETYNIGGHNEKTNLEVARLICKLLDEMKPNHPNGISSYLELITHVEDRPGHDRRYAIDAKKIKDNLNWLPDNTFESGLRKTVKWYLENLKWCHDIQNGNYQRERIGKIENKGKHK
mgnify:FL=1